jgi:hypothetical protein
MGSKVTWLARGRRARAGPFSGLAIWRSLPAYPGLGLEEPDHAVLDVEQWGVVLTWGWFRRTGEEVEELLDPLG